MNTKIDLHRFDDQLAVIESELSARLPARDGILFYGSSTMANWRAEGMCYRQMAPYRIANTGFGGSTAEEALYYYHRLVMPVHPSVIVYYEGANDLSNGYTPEEVLATTHRLFEWARQDFPGIRFLIIPIKLSPGLLKIEPEGRVCNAMFEEYARQHEDTSIVDVAPLLYDGSGTLRTDIYVEDLLHHNEKGYEELAGLVKAGLEKIIPPAMDAIA